jgi:hypothetical protein
MPHGVRDMGKRTSPLSAAERQRQCRRRKADAVVAATARAQVWAIIQAQLAEPGNHPELQELVRRLASQFSGEFACSNNMIGDTAVTAQSLGESGPDSASLPGPTTAECPFTMTRSIKPASRTPVWVVTPKHSPYYLPAPTTAPAATFLEGA